MSVSYDQLVAGNCFGGIDVTTPMISKREKNELKNDDEQEKTISNICKQFDLSLVEIFDEARRFLKEQQKNPTVQISYDENVRFVALLKQSKFGPWSPSFSTELGFLDVVGNDRKRAWAALGPISKENAMEEFVKKVFQRFPTFDENLTRLKEKLVEKQEQDARRILENEQILHLARIEEQKKKYEDFQRKQIQQALNQQTYSQFKIYAEQHYKDNPQAQEELIRQLQEEHFQQYLRQVYQQQLNQQKEKSRSKKMEEEKSKIAENFLPQPAAATNLSSSSILNELPPLGPAPTNLAPIVHPPPVVLPQNEVPPVVENQFETLSLNTPLEPIGKVPENFSLNETTNDGSTTLENFIEKPNENQQTVQGENPTIIAVPNMWTRKDVKEFKDQLRKEKDAVIKIGSGETVTVRVPTHDEGQCIFWEFSTDYYDLGFGVYFEWSKSPSNTVTVHVSDSSEEDEENEDATNPEKKDVEKGAAASTNKPAKPRQDEIVPICRRDSHEEVYAGSHQYPGEGVYLLKFDNSYSLWRSKTLYYRVYYSK